MTPERTGLLAILIFFGLALGLAFLALIAAALQGP